jgi:ubiquinone/menaquinone biosynthesis C-methylase UbiE
MRSGSERIASVSDQTGGAPPLRIRAVARGMSAVIARAPFLWPVLKRPTQRFWDKTAPRWDDRVGADSDARAAPLAAACDRLEQDPRRILELGTGTGAGALMLTRRFPDAEVWAVDLSEAMIRQAQAKAPEDTRARLHFAVADAAALPHDAESTDLICQLNLPLYADEIVRVLAPGGHVAIASTLGPRTPYYTPHRVLRRRFQKLGLEVLDSGRVGEGDYFLARRPGTGNH